MMLKNRTIRRFAQLFAVMVVIAGSFTLYQLWNHNFHEVLPGELYRSGQFGEGDIAEYVKDYGIRSIINLRGENKGSPWYDAEIHDAKAAGITHIDFRMSSKRVLADAELAQLIRIMRDAPKPTLIHCNGGANRTGLAAAIYLTAIAKTDLETAENQLSVRFGNFPEWAGSASKMSRNFEMVKDALQAKYQPAPTGTK